MVTILPLKLKEASVQRGGRRLIGPIDLEIKAGQSLVILGPNGAGKSTLLRALHGLERLSSGSLSVTAGRAGEGSGQSFVFQSPVLLRRSTLENVSYPLRLQGCGKTETQERSNAALSSVGLSELALRRASNLSGGEKQKLALARALVTRPEIVFLDEPTASLDGRSTREFEAILNDARAAGTTLVMATQHLGQARRLASDVLFLLDGRIHEARPAEAFFADPSTEAARAFLKGDIVE